MNLAQIATCAVALMALSASCAQAAPALATNNVNMRQGPGTNYPVITTIPGGSTVEVSGCQGEWCSVSWHGQSGYAIAARLDRAAARRLRGAQAHRPATLSLTRTEQTRAWRDLHRRLRDQDGPPGFGTSAGGAYPPPPLRPPARARRRSGFAAFIIRILITYGRGTGALVPPLVIPA